MIVVADHGELLLVTQPDHARFSWQLLSLWRHPALLGHPRRQLLLGAIREHDNGWLEADAAPHIAAGGRPHDFRSLPDEPRQQIWRRGLERLSATDPYAALLLILHGLRLHRKRQDASWRELLNHLEERREELLAATGLSDELLAADYRWLRLADEISLAVCEGGRTRLEGLGFRAVVDRHDIEIEPFPLAGATTFEIPCRRLEDRRYDGEADLARALATARWSRLQARCRPSPAGR